MFKSLASDVLGLSDIGKIICSIVSKCVANSKNV
jgi:hypothetical protein